MKQHIRLMALVLGAAALFFSGCRLSDQREFTVRAPGLKNDACVERVARALAVLDGVDLASLRFDVAAGTIQVRYESMKLGRKNIEHAIARAGFDANDIPAPAAAKAELPESCR